LISLEGKIEAGGILVGWESGSFHLVGNRSDLALSHLCFEKLGEEWDSLIEGRSPLLDEITAWAMPYILRPRNMTRTAALAGS